MDQTEQDRIFSVSYTHLRMNQWKPNLNLDTVGLAYLTDFYYDARYPGDDFYTVTKEEFDKCKEIMYDTILKLKEIPIKNLKLTGGE